MCINNSKDVYYNDLIMPRLSSELLQNLFAKGQYFCRYCEETKPLNEFTKHSHSPTGYRACCLDCNKYLAYHSKILTLAEYKSIIRTECEICGGSRRLCLDHDHDTNTFRGVLCTKCNSDLGWYERNKERFENYLISKKG